MTTLIETRKLTKRFGSILAVDNLSFTVRKGEVLGFLGPNGAGKSTTMKMLTCFLAPTSGTAKVHGHDILESPVEVKKAIGYLPETAPAYAEMTPVSFLKFVGRIRGFRGSELGKAVDAVIEKVALASVRHQTFETLSKGYKRRVGLAQALIHDPPILIMDEPTDGLDPNQKHDVRQLISRMAEEKCILLSTHILEEVDAVCTRATIIANGRIVADMTPAELRRLSPRHGAVTIAMTATDPSSIREALMGLPNVDKVKVIGDAGGKKLRLEIFPRNGSHVAGDVAHLARDRQWDIDELHVERGRLDDVFRDLTLTQEPAKSKKTVPKKPEKAGKAKSS